MALTYVVRKGSEAKALAATFRYHGLAVTEEKARLAGCPVLVDTEGADPEETDKIAWSVCPEAVRVP